MHTTDTFIVNSADLKYAKNKNILNPIVDDTVLEYMETKNNNFDQLFLGISQLD